MPTPLIFDIFVASQNAKAIFLAKKRLIFCCCYKRAKIF